MYSYPLTLLLVCGMQGAGKSTLAHEIVRKLHFTYLDKDVLQDAFTIERTGENYERIREPSYRALYALTGANLRLGNSVLLDAPLITDANFPNQKWCSFIQELATSNGAQLKVIWVYLPREQRLARIAERMESGNIRDKLQFEAFSCEPDVEITNSFLTLTYQSEVTEFQKVLDFLSCTEVS